MKKTIIINFIIRIISMGISFMYIPIALKFLGVENYGIWATLLSIFSWITFFDVGIGNSLRTTLVEHIEKNEIEKVRELVSTSYINIAIIAIVFVISAILVLNFIDIGALLNINYNRLERLIFLSFCFCSLNFVISLCKQIYYAYQNTITVSIIELTAQCINFMGVLIFSYYKIENNLIYVSLLYGGTYLSVNLYFTYRLFRVKQFLIPKIINYKKSLNNKINILGIKFFLIQIVVLILFTTDSLIITKLFGASEVTPYSISNKIFGIVTSFYSIILTPLWSRVSKEKINGNIKWIRETLKKLNILSAIVGIGIIILYFIYPFILKFWLRENIVYSNSLIAYMAFFTFLSIWCNNHAYIMNGMGEIDTQLKVAIVQGIINIPLSIYLGKYLEMRSSGVILATCLCMLISAIIFPLKLKKRLK